MENRIGIKKLFKYVMAGYIINMALLLLYAVVLTFSNLSEDTMTICTVILGIICVFFTSLLLLKKTKKNGLKNGAIVGIIFALLVFFTSCLLSHELHFSAHTIITMLTYVIVSIFGGIIGVNMF